MAKIHGHPINVIGGDDLVLVLDMIARADREGQVVRFATTENGLMVKVGYGMWTPTLGTNDVS